MIGLALVLSALVAQASAPMMPTPPAPQSAGDFALRAGNFDDAFTKYQSAYQANPKDANAVLGIGTIDLYRNDLTEAKTYLTQAATLLPDDPRIKARLRTVEQREAAQTDLTAKPVTIKFLAVDPLPMLHVQVNGKQMNFILDTGGPGIDISPNAAKALGLNLVEAGQGVFAGGMTAKTYRSTIASFAIGSITMKNVDVGVLPDALNSTHIDGVLGTGFFSHFLTTIDYKEGELELRPRSAAATYLAHATQRGAAVVPMWLVGDHFIFSRAHVNDQPDALFNIDTGGGGLGVQLTKAQVDAAHIAMDTAKASSFTGGAGAAPAIPFTAPSVSLGSVTKSNVPGLFFPDGDQYKIFSFDVAGTISHEFFKSGELTFDFVDMKLIVST